MITVYFKFVEGLRFRFFFLLLVFFAGRERFSPNRSRMSSTEDASVVWSRLPVEQREDRRSVVPVFVGAARGPHVSERATYSGTAAGAGGGASIWDLALTFWPLEDRPEPMKCVATLNGMRLQGIMQS
jgi:hypothetical protein